MHKRYLTNKIEDEKIIKILKPKLNENIDEYNFDKYEYIVITKTTCTIEGLDKWDTSNCVPRRVQLTFWMKPIEEDKEPYPVVRVVEIPLWDVSQNPVKIDSSGSDGKKGGKK